MVDVDFRRGIANVVPAPAGGKVRWLGDGRALSLELCQGIRRTLAGEELEATRLSRRASDRLERVRSGFSWVRASPESVVLRDENDAVWWWTFAGARANLWLAGALGDLSDQSVPEDLRIRLKSDADAGQVAEVLEVLDLDHMTLGARIAENAIDRLKFGEALPGEMARRVVAARLRDDPTVAAVRDWPVRGHTRR